MSDSTDNICLGHEGAPFCGGPSMRECAGGYEVPENEVCPGNDTSALGDPDPYGPRNSCEEDGTCDDSCTAPARDDCTVPGAVPTTAPTPDTDAHEAATVTTTTEEVPVLPLTGPADTGPLGAAAMACLVLGAVVVRLTNKKGA